MNLFPVHVPRNIDDRLTGNAVCAGNALLSSVAVMSFTLLAIQQFSVDSKVGGVLSIVAALVCCAYGYKQQSDFLNSHASNNITDESEQLAANLLAADNNV